MLVMLACSAAEGQTIRVATARLELQLRVEHGHLVQTAFGAIGKQASRPEEFYPAGGAGYIWEPAIMAIHADGNTSTDLVYASHQINPIDDNRTETRIELKDPQYPFFVTLCFKSYRDQDVIEQWSEIRHEETGPVVLTRFASSAPIFHASEFNLTQFHGEWANEMNRVREKLTNGTKILDSKLGSRADYYQHKSFILSLAGNSTEKIGEVFGGSLEWSGSFQFAFEMADNRLRVLCGMNPYDSEYRLDPQRFFKTPAMLWTWSDHGTGEMSRNLHRWCNRYAIRDGGQPRPVLFNNWEATGFGFDEGRLVSLFDGAKEVGAETFLLDDGWFGNKHPRNDDHAGLGDWQVNAKKLPHGIKYLVDQAQKRGLRFGIWVEPEMVNPRSDLFEAHPDWAIQQPKRDLNFFRNQLVLDLTRPEVRDFVFSTVDDLLTDNPGIAYIKWDCNRYITQPGSTYLKPEYQQNLWIDYVNALYDIMNRVAARHPDVEMMLCSGGGGRVDYAALRYFDEFWPSDNTDPVSRVRIQWGYSQFFPATAIAAHVTRWGDRPLKFAADVAMSGSLGMDMDLAKLSPDERQSIASAVAAYKTIRDLIAGGDLYRLESPYDGPRSALMYVAPDRSRAVMFVYQLSDASPSPVMPDGLDAHRQYRMKELDVSSPRLLDDGKTRDGASLMKDGIITPCQKALDSAVIELVPQ
jgi:alpha-galactosidase